MVSWWDRHRGLGFTLDQLPSRGTSQSLYCTVPETRGCAHSELGGHLLPGRPEGVCAQGTHCERRGSASTRPSPVFSNDASESLRATSPGVRSPLVSSSFPKPSKLPHTFLRGPHARPPRTRPCVSVRPVKKPESPHQEANSLESGHLQLKAVRRTAASESAASLSRCRTSARKPDLPRQSLAFSESPGESRDTKLQTHQSRGALDLNN